jgi:hypothetical protein
MSALKASHWVWAGYSGEPGLAFVTQWGGLPDEDGRKLLNGQALDPLPQPSVRRHEPGTFTGALGDSTGFLVLAPELVAVLQAAGARLQLVPVTVPRQPQLQYAIANVLDSVPALDMEGSKLSTFAGTDVIDRITKLALRPLPADAPGIFHVAEHPVLVLVNDALRQQLQAASPQPGVFTRVEAWRTVH